MDRGAAGVDPKLWPQMTATLGEATSQSLCLVNLCTCLYLVNLCIGLYLFVFSYGWGQGQHGEVEERDGEAAAEVDSRPRRFFVRTALISFYSCAGDVACSAGKIASQVPRSSWQRSITPWCSRHGCKRVDSQKTTCLCKQMCTLLWKTQQICGTGCVHSHGNCMHKAVHQYQQKHTHTYCRSLRMAGVYQEMLMMSTCLTWASLLNKFLRP